MKEKPEPARHSTAIHEAGHAVVSYVLGRRVMHAVLFDDRRGEVMPECAACDTCISYYKSFKEPVDAMHWKHIEDDLRRDIAIAIAGEIAETEICGDHYIDEGELRQDRALSQCRVSLIHYRRERKCLWEVFKESCRVCDDYLTLMREKMQIIRQPPIRTAIEEFAEQLEQRENHQQMDEKTIDRFLEAGGLTQGSAFDSLPESSKIMT